MNQTACTPKKCPSCDGFIPNNMMPGKCPGALSRLDDETEICSDCETSEAMSGLRRGSKERIDALLKIAGLGHLKLECDFKSGTYSISDGERTASGLLIEIECAVGEWPGSAILAWRPSEFSSDVDPVVRAVPGTDEYGYAVDVETGKRSELLKNVGRGEFVPVEAALA